jgi:CheY-like chemotaxis protein
MTDDKLSLPVVLIVDDDPDLRSLMVDIVEDAGFMVVVAGDADEAAVILEARLDIALVLTDINMPGSMDGLKLAHAVRERWPSIKIIVMSGQMHPHGRELPADSRFFAKPFRPEHMMSEIQSLMGA